VTTQQDAQIGFKKETVFRTPVTVDMFPEFVGEDLDWNPTFAQGAGLRVQRRVDADSRRVLVKDEVGGSFTLEPHTKGLGRLIEAALGGTGTSTLASGAAYQQLFTPTTTDDLSSYTIQKGIPLVGGGSSQPTTFNGMVCSGFEFQAGNGAIPTIKFNWVGAGVDTSTGLATANYLTGDELFSFIHASLTLGGAVTVPTTTALASGGTAATNIREFNCTYSNALDANGFNVGGAGKRTRKPKVGKRVITGSFVAEFDATTIRDLFLSQTSVPLVFTLTSLNAITGAYYPAFQITLPAIRLEGELPKTNGGDVVTLAVNFTAFDNGVAAHPVYIAIVTVETSI
jgi:hypothetical protein